MDRVSRLVRNLTFAGAFVSFSIAQAQQDLNTAQPHVERHDFAKAAPAYDLDAGKSEFLSSCAPCHGTDGKGNGSLSTQLKTKPADLTVLAKKNDGFFPIGTAYEFIDGRKLVGAHGTRDMPIWGRVYNQEAQDRLIDPRALDTVELSDDPDAVVRARILSLLDYINRIQEK